MTVSTSDSKGEFDGNGVTTIFDYGFLVLDEEHLQVFLDGTLQTSGFTVTGVGDDNGGTVIFATAPASGTTVTLNREVPLTQEIEYDPYDPFPPKTHEKGLDLGVMRAQQLSEQISRTMLLPQGGDSYDAKGNKIVNVLKGTDDNDAVNNVRMYDYTYDKESIDSKDANVLSQAKTYAENVGSEGASSSENAITLTDGQSVVDLTTGTNYTRGANGSAFYTNGAYDDSRLLLGEDYSITGDDEITLTDTYPAGVIIRQVAFDVVSPNSYLGLSDIPNYPTAAIASLANVPVGIRFTVADLAGAPFESNPVGSTVLPGDLTSASGLVYRLLEAPDGSYDVQWFGAPNDPDDILGSQTAFFELAAQRAGSGPSGGVINVFSAHRVDGSTTSATTWRVGPRTKIFGRPGVSPSSDYDLSGLLGQVINLNSADAYGVVYYGDPTFYVQKITNKTDTDAAVTGAGVKGSPGATFTSFTSGSDFNPSRQSSIGATFRVVVDSALGITGWGNYTECYRLPDSVGNCFGAEITCFNVASVVVSNPYAQPGDTTGVTIGHWFSAGGAFGSPTSIFGEYTETIDATAAIGMIGKAGAKYVTGIIAYDGSISTGEVIAMPGGYQIAWWGGAPGSRQKVAYVSGANPSGNNGQMQLNVFDDSTGQFDYLYYASGQFSAIENNKVTLGNAGSVYRGAWFQNAPTVVSDITKKTEIRQLSDGELSAGLALARNVEFFKWIDEVESNKDKGKKSYEHLSIMAQTVWATFVDNGLDPTDYGMVSNDPNGWNITPSEISFLMCAALVKNQDLIEQRLAALEA